MRGCGPDSGVGEAAGSCSPTFLPGNEGKDTFDTNYVWARETKDEYNVPDSELGT